MGKKDKQRKRLRKFVQLKEAQRLFDDPTTPIAKETILANAIPIKLETKLNATLPTAKKEPDHELQRIKKGTESCLFSPKLTTSNPLRETDLSLSTNERIIDKSVAITTSLRESHSLELGSEYGSIDFENSVAKDGNFNVCQAHQIKISATRLHFIIACICISMLSLGADFSFTLVSSPSISSEFDHLADFFIIFGIYLLAIPIAFYVTSLTIKKYFISSTILSNLLALISSLSCTYFKGLNMLVLSRILFGAACGSCCYIDLTLCEKLVPTNTKNKYSNIALAHFGLGTIIPALLLNRNILTEWSSMETTITVIFAPLIVSFWLALPKTDKNTFEYSLHGMKMRHYLILLLTLFTTSALYIIACSSFDFPITYSSLSLWFTYLAVVFYAAKESRNKGIYDAEISCWFLTGAYVSTTSFIFMLMEIQDLNTKSLYLSLTLSTFLGAVVAKKFLEDHIYINMVIQLILLVLQGKVIDVHSFVTSKTIYLTALTSTLMFSFGVALGSYFSKLNKEKNIITILGEGTTSALFAIIVSGVPFKGIVQENLKRELSQYLPGDHSVDELKYAIKKALSSVEWIREDSPDLISTSIFSCYLDSIRYVFIFNLFCTCIGISFFHLARTHKQSSI
ncbi:hypothetical protein KAFR_0B05450 [Kazachstania africana CBS 2517]|uniref:Uncharacterized protein n=1 Tax=Kazachstania africana (strain ATCC 22294 / BCRC 22015 / CBS 2517 / CECT 1963 / NBRC 1671 / NRRL Y-8276) TaxID=1071382 RepID=H2AR40_KAZAF|nr:hypothetical protein KAFR_0B05450 [Kazachstania africana CBS 2517]CCF56840.1 hypothetical protein KAFR_0B05450 [Kazachstania africana CBS 2517]